MRAFLALLWSLPVAIPVWLFLTINTLAGAFRIHGDPLSYRGWLPVFRVEVLPGSWLGRLWDRRFAGAGLPFVALLRSDCVEDGFVIRHESRHCAQWAVLGPLFPVLYLLALVFFGYRLNPFETDATRFAYRFDEE